MTASHIMPVIRGEIPPREQARKVLRGAGSGGGEIAARDI
jgi:hypothetical protein